ncbi:MAG: superfamily [Actinomycetia bacterium]|nr:superfamily [Actinomycetes bacterium]
MTTTEAPEKPLRRGGRPLRDGHAVYWWFELVFAGAFYLVYSTIRNLNEGGRVAAFHHAQTIISWERSLGLYHEATLQGWALHFRPLIVLCNYFYGSAHFIVTIGAIVFLYRRHSDDYPLWRNTLAIATALALIGFVTYPLMPPRLLDTMGAHYGFVDTLHKYPTFWSFDSGGMEKLSNQFAAMPSVHCCWAGWCACVFAPRVKQRWARLLAIGYPVFTVVVIVLTANHYFLDAVGGFGVLAIGYAGARTFTRAGRTPTPTPTNPQTSVETA